MRLEAIFGGALAAFVLVVAAYALWKGRLVDDPYHPPADRGDQYTAIPRDPVCQCYDDGFDLAGSNVGVMSAQYRSGFENCRARLGEGGSTAWTAGWNARLSSRPYEASCEIYLRNG